MSVFTGRPPMYGASMGLTLETYVGAGSWGGSYDKPNRYGIMETSRLILNTWERLTGREGSMEYEHLSQPEQECTRRVGGVATISPRRELLAFAEELGQGLNIGVHLNTEPDNPYRRLTDDDMAELAGSVSADNPLFIRHLDLLDKSALNFVPQQHRSTLREARRQMREEMGFPPNTSLG